jgi:hypothetical protein
MDISNNDEIPLDKNANSRCSFIRSTQHKFYKKYHKQIN